MLHGQLIAPIPDLLRRQAAERGAQVAYRDARGGVTYADLLARTGRLAGHFADLGVSAGDKIAIYLPSSVAWIETCFAATRAGAVCVPISYDATEPEVAYRLADAGCRLVVTTDERAAMIERLRIQVPDVRETILVDRGERQAGRRFAELAAAPPRSAPRDPTTIDEPAYIIYTSGTTGKAKGVLLSVHSLLWVTAACWAPITGLTAQDVVLSPLPLFHSYALSLSVLSVLAVGASEYIMERFSVSEARTLLKSGGFTFFPGVPTMFHYLLQAAEADPALACPGLRLCVSAGAIMPATLNQAFEARFGVPLLDGYGITETSTMVTMNWPTGSRVPGACGLPVPGLAVRLIDAVTEDDVPLGREGELIVRGPNVMHGYHNKPAETATALRNGWYYTGDLARSDANGFLTITGRLKELIIRGGQNIAPAEIEEAVNTFEGVVDCAVIGVAHETLGEVANLFVVPRDGPFDVERLLVHCRARLSAYKIPEATHFVAEIPRTGSGKIMRFKLRELLQRM